MIKERLVPVASLAACEKQGSGVIGMSFLGAAGTRALPRPSVCVPQTQLLSCSLSGPLGHTTARGLLAVLIPRTQGVFTYWTFIASCLGWVS